MLVILGNTKSAVATALYASAVTGEKVCVWGVEDSRLTKVISGQTPVGTVTDGVGWIADQDLNAHLQQADLIVVVSDPYWTGSLIDRIKENISGRKVLLAPGSFAACYRYEQLFTNLQPPILCETTGFIAGGLTVDGDIGTVRMLKNGAPIASGKSPAHDEAIDLALRYFPCLKRSDLATTSLCNTNNIIHPPLMIAHASRIAARENFLFYRDGFTADICRLLERADWERCQLAGVIGADTRSILDWLRSFYGSHGFRGDNLYEALGTFEPFAEVQGPITFNHRYLTEDVGVGIACYSQLARIVGMQVPVLNGLVEISEQLIGKSLKPDLSEVEGWFRTLN